MPVTESRLEYPENRTFLILGRASAASDGLAAALGVAGCPVIQVIPGSSTRRTGEREFEVDFSDEGSSAPIRALIADLPALGAIINLLPMDAATDSNGASLAANSVLFLTLKLFAADLVKGDEPGWLINFTSLDGKFGLAGSGHSGTMDQWQAGSIGITKSVSREYPALRTKCIDIEPEIDPHMMLAMVIDELDSANSAIEVGLTASGRHELELSPENPGPPNEESNIEITSESVILVTGGAHGITAAFARHFAEQFKCRLIILGRSPEPEPESTDTNSMITERDLREHLIAESRLQDASMTPATIEKHLRNIIKNREIAGTLDSIRSSGSEVSYFPVDITDADTFRKVIEDTYIRYGRIDGVIHGAGIIDDHLLHDKSLDSFERVFRTKAVPADVLLRSLRGDSLKFVLFFSSVAARFGNVGQADYSAANEVLNKVSHIIDKRWPDVRALSVNWGPWKAGMVSETLANLYASKGLGLIPPELGLQLGIEELFTKNDNEVLIAADTRTIVERGLG